MIDNKTEERKGGRPGYLYLGSLDKIWTERKFKTQTKISKKKEEERERERERGREREREREKK